LIIHLVQFGQAKAAVTNLKTKPVDSGPLTQPELTMSEVKKSRIKSPAKRKKPKLVRDSFTIPKDEYEAFDVLKQRLAKLGKAVKKSELVRAGLLALASSYDARLVAYLEALPDAKSGQVAPLPAVKMPSKKILPKNEPGVAASGRAAKAPVVSDASSSELKPKTSPRARRPKPVDGSTPSKA
jgi:hypothetical protein